MRWSSPLAQHGSSALAGRWADRRIRRRGTPAERLILEAAVASLAPGSAAIETVAFMARAPYRRAFVQWSRAIDFSGRLTLNRLGPAGLSDPTPECRGADEALVSLQRCCQIGGIEPDRATEMWGDTSAASGNSAIVPKCVSPRNRENWSRADTGCFQRSKPKTTALLRI